MKGGKSQNVDNRLNWFAMAATWSLALILIGGSVWATLIGRDVPQWMIGFDGMVATFAFAQGAFFVQARTAEPTSNALADMGARYHELAMATATTTTPANSGTTIVVPQHVESGSVPNATATAATRTDGGN